MKHFALLNSLLRFFRNKKWKVKISFLPNGGMGYVAVGSKPPLHLKPHTRTTQEGSPGNCLFF